MRRVVVTGLGAVTPLGVGVPRTWKRLIDGHTGIVSTRHEGPGFEALPSQVAGIIPKGPREDGKWTASEYIAAGDIRKMALFSQYAMAAADEALEDADWHPTTDKDKEATGVSIGSGIGNFEEVYDTSVRFSKGHKSTSPHFVPLLLINLAAAHIAMRHSLHGPNNSPTTACTTGAHSIGDSFRAISHPSPSSPRIMLAGASESCIHPLAVSGFSRARSLATHYNATPELASRPFDAARDGFVIAEGAGVLVLEELEHALRRGARVYAEIVGYGASCDAHHVTAPLADGRGAALAMRRALADAGVQPRGVDYVNAHATGTRLGDLAENRAVKAVLLGGGGGASGGAGRRSADFKTRAGEINISSTKGAIGHLLGAAGAVEAIFTVLAIARGVLPPTANLDALGDGAVGGREGEGKGDGWRGEREESEWNCNYIAKVAQERDVRVALTNSFGFGGTNASLCFRRFER